MFAICAATFVFTIPAQAADPTYVGTWGIDAAQCKVPQEQEGAPMIITANGYDQHEAHCTFTSAKTEGLLSIIAADCSVEGDSQNVSLELEVTGDVLILGRSTTKAARKLVRCK